MTTVACIRTFETIKPAQPAVPRVIMAIMIILVRRGRLRSLYQARTWRPSNLLVSNHRWRRVEPLEYEAAAMIRNIVVGNPGTTIPMMPVRRLVVPSPMKNHRAALDRAKCSSPGVSSVLSDIRRFGLLDMAVGMLDVFWVVKRVSCAGPLSIVWS